MFLFIDNYDSFSWNLVQAFYALGRKPVVRANDDPHILELAASPELEANALSHNDHFPSVFQGTDHVVVNHFFNFHTCPHQYQPVFNSLICFYIIRQHKRNKKTNSEQISATQNIVQNWSCLPYSNNPICCYSNHVILMLP